MKKVALLLFLSSLGSIARSEIRSIDITIFGMD